MSEEVASSSACRSAEPGWARVGEITERFETAPAGGLEDGGGEPRRDERTVVQTHSSRRTSSIPSSS